MSLKPHWTTQGMTRKEARNTASCLASVHATAPIGHDTLRPSPWIGQPLSRLVFAAFVANGQRGRLLTRASHSLDNACALRPTFDEDGLRARRNFSGAEDTRYAALPSSRP
jgi:hypothetical protein